MLTIYYEKIKNNLISIYNNKKEAIRQELKENIKSNSSFSLTLDAWTALNQDAYLGITM